MAAFRYLITGGGGQLARSLHRRLAESVAPSREQLSITDADQLRRELSRLAPQYVFNCAAYNAVDQAENEPEVARAVNSEGAANVARACREVGARLVHFSTNYVFDGTADRPYLETAVTSPRGAYARSKREGEERVLDLLDGALVIRSSGLFGHGGSAVKGGSFPHRLISRARAGEPLAVVADQLLNPTYTGHLAEASIASALDGTNGILHLVAAGCCSFHEFALGALRVAGLERPIAAIATPPEDDRARRPRNGCLESARAEALPAWQEGLAAFWREELETVAG